MNLTINNHTVETDRRLTILEVAEENGIYIPKMCAHHELVPYGGCRLCIVEIEGFRGYPTACTTMAEEGMVVRTDTNTLMQMRIDLVQLILSEHPSACLLCSDTDGCSNFQGTIRKVGITTGCRWCPKDNDCELQRIVDTFDIQELTLPGLYRDLPVEKYDPFFDRDYNLCIYCGRCVRICTEYRRSSVLSLRQRGKHTTIGPAFDTNHTQAGCEYCGACVSVCPTGAMSEKSRKWWGLPDSRTQSVCPLCSLNCEIQALSVKNKIVGTIPTGTPHESAGELCVKGRFCLSELVNRTERMLEPEFLFDEGTGIVHWDEAKTKGSDILKSVEPGRSAIFVSPDLSMEEYAAVGVFAEKVLKTTNISSSFLNDNLIAYLRLSEKSSPYTTISKAGAILSLFLNGNYNYAPLTMAVKEAASRDIPYFQTGWISDTTTRFARGKFVPEPGGGLLLLDQMIECLRKGECSDPDIIKMVACLRETSNPVIIAGPSILSISGCINILERIEKIVEETGAKLVMPDPGGNMKGMLAILKMMDAGTVFRKIDKGEIDLLYLAGDIPYKKRPGVKQVIIQTAFPVPEELNPNLVLPAAIWGETGGTWPGQDGSPVTAEPASLPHQYARPHTEILAELGKATGVKMPGKYAVPGKSHFKPILPDTGNNKSAGKTDHGRKMPFVLFREEMPHRYQGIDLSASVSGFSTLVKTGYAVINPADAKKLGTDEGDEIMISSDNVKKKFKLLIRKNIPAGIVYMATLNNNSDFKTNPCWVNIRRAHV